MSTLKKDHILGAGAGALAGGALGGAAGGLLAGPAGMALGVSAGVALGAVAADQFVEEHDPRGDLGHFEQVFRTTAYYKEGMAWEDYRPAYAYGMAVYHNPDRADPEHFIQEWALHRGASRLSADEAWPAAEHVRRSYDEAVPAS